MKKLLYISLILFLTAITVGCKKEFDTPPVRELPARNVITIDSLRNMYSAFDINITQDLSVYGVVTADETTGNIYKELFIQDETNAIKLDLSSSSDFYIGDRVRVALKGATLTRDANMIVVENIDPETNIIKQESGNDLTPEVVNINDLTLVGLYTPYQSKLVQINNVEFDCADFCETWANAITQSDENRTLTDTSGNTIIVRSSGYSTFANQQLPQGQGSIIGIVTQYNSDLQLTIRTPNEANMYGARKNNCNQCPNYLYQKDWSDNNLTSGGWTTQYPVPNNSWTVDNFSGSNPYAYITNTNSQLVGESWLISPAFDLSSTSSPYFNFTSASATSNTALKVLISTNYDGVSLPSTATWTDITSSLTLSSGSWNWTGSGDFNLSPYKVSGVYIAFKYNGSGSSWTTWEIDNFNLFEL